MASERRGSLPLPAATTTYNSETAEASCWSPCTRHLDDALGLRAKYGSYRRFAPRDSTQLVCSALSPEDASPRSYAPRHSRQLVCLAIGQKTLNLGVTLLGTQDGSFAQHSARRCFISEWRSSRLKTARFLSVSLKTAAVPCIFGNTMSSA